jgi:4-amino-4-deoxy-L-arabinose transferase-like glycosyltransferase
VSVRRAVSSIVDSTTTVYVLVAVVAAVLFLVNLNGAPDYDVDEVLYTLAGQNIDHFGQIAWGVGPILVHPPLFFLTVGGWLALLGDQHAPLISALHDARSLNVLFAVGDSVLTASLARQWTTRSGRSQSLLMLLAGVLVALNPFLDRFGRTVLIEPMALFLGLLTVRVAWALRRAPAPTYVCCCGVLIGLAVLTKEPSIFVAGSPLVTSLLARDRRGTLRNLGAVAVGAVVFSSFAIYCAVQGQSTALYNQQTYNIRRLIGVIQVSGLNRHDVSPLAAFSDTLLQYAVGYLVLLVGGLGLLRLLVRGWRVLPHDEAAAMLTGYGLLSYIFLAYSIFIGQSNEQLTVYAVPAAALLTLLAWSVDIPPKAAHKARATHRVRRTAIAVTLVVAVGGGAAAWGKYLTIKDDATADVGAWVTSHFPVCTRINATGNATGWQETLPQDQVGAFSYGPTAVAHGVHLFLLSPKDSRNHYGSSSPALQAYVESHGQELYTVSSHTYERISVWQIGTLPAFVAGETCRPAATSPAHAAVWVFGSALGGVLVLVASGYGAAEYRRRRSTVLE